jgi:hypothetical protein
MVCSLENDQRVRGRLKFAPMTVGASNVGLKSPKPRGARIENERNRIGDEPFGAIADEEAEHALSYQGMQIGQILVSVENGFVQGSLSILMWAI